MSMRSAAVAALTGAMPATWTVIDDERSLNNIRQPTMIVSVRTIEPADFAPLSHLIVTMAVIVLSPHTDATASEDELDTLLVEAVAGIGSLPNLTWSTATKIVHLERFMGYEITTTSTAELGD